MTYTNITKFILINKQFSNQYLNFQNKFCNTIRKVLNHQIQFKYYRLPCHSVCSNNKFDDILLSENAGKPHF